MDHLDEPVRMLVSRRSLAALHHLWGKDAVRSLADSFMDELERVIEEMKSTGDYAKVAAETVVDLVNQTVERDAKQAADQSD